MPAYLRLPLLILVLCACPAFPKDIAVPGDAPDLATALRQAKADDTIRLADGQFAGDIVVDKPVTIRGINWDKTRIVGQKTTLTIDADVTLENLKIVGADTGVFVKAGRHLGAFSCAFVDAQTDGIGFEPSTATTLELSKCLVANNVDGIDLESTQGLIMDTVFQGNRDDGLDYDGDARVTCIGCRFEDSGDDGVEIRLRDTTEAVFSRCRFSGNGEDGLEIINSPLDKPKKNVLILGHNTFADNARWGVGFVTATPPEEAQPNDFTKAAVLWGVNEFADNGKGAVSPNHAPEMQRATPTAEQVTIQMTRPGEDARACTVPLHAELPVATISMRPALNGKQAGDVEGITNFGRRLFLADDNLPGLHEIDLRTKEVTRQFRTKPIPGTDLTVGGTEGLSVIEHEGRDALLLSCDDEDLVLTLDASEESFGVLLRKAGLKEQAPYCEGIEQLGARVYAVYGGNKIRVLSARDYQPLEGLTCTLKPVGFGAHVAGVGTDGKRLLVTASAYRVGTPEHTQFSLIIALDPNTLVPTEAWQIPYLDDPRGISWANGLAWVADGMSPYTDKELGRTTADGLRVLVVALSPTVTDTLRLWDLPGPWFGK